MSRQIITKEHVLEALDAGQTELRLEPNDIITSVAVDAAEQKGLLITRTDAPDRSTTPLAASPGAAPTPTKTPPSPMPEGAPTARQVKQAIVDQLGKEPDGLDALIAKVLKD